jgi:hypothetical protein
LETATLNLKLIPDVQTSPWLNPLIIETHLTAGNRFTSLRTRFEKTRSPQPFVDSDRFVHSNFIHKQGSDQNGTYLSPST